MGEACAFRQIHAGKYNRGEEEKIGHKGCHEADPGDPAEFGKSPKVVDDQDEKGGAGGDDRDGR